MKFWFGLLVGGAMGAAAGVLMAPKSGQQLRGSLADQAELMRNQGLGKSLERPTSELRQNLNEVRDIIREAFAEGKEVLKEALEEGRKASAATTANLTQQYRESVQPGSGDDKKDDQPQGQAGGSNQAPPSQTPTAQGPQTPPGAGQAGGASDATPRPAQPPSGGASPTTSGGSGQSPSSSSPERPS